MSWSNNVFAAPNQLIGNGSGLTGQQTFFMWDEITPYPLSNYLDSVGSSISDNSTLGSLNGILPPEFVDTMGNFAFSLYGNNVANSIMDYDRDFD